MPEDFSVPQRTYEYLKQIIIAYTKQGDSVNNVELSKKYELTRTSVSVSNAFFIDMGIIEETTKGKKRITESGKKLGLSLNGYPADIESHWKTIITGKPKRFFKELLYEIKEKKLKTKVEIKSAIYKIANVSSEIIDNDDYQTGAFAIIDILKLAGCLAVVEEDRFEVTNDLTQYEDDKKNESPQALKLKIKTINGAKGRKIFIVHGHNREMKETVARFIESLDLEPVILDERGDKNRTLIEKVFDHASEIGFAVVLLSPDDMGYSIAKGARSKKPRARQNVILELGMFLGMLGKSHVVLIIKDREKIEFPSDYNGVLTKDFDTSNNWKIGLVHELKECDYDVDANRLFK